MRLLFVSLLVLQFFFEVACIDISRSHITAPSTNQGHKFHRERKINWRRKSRIAINKNTHDIYDIPNNQSTSLDHVSVSSSIRGGVNSDVDSNVAQKAFTKKNIVVVSLTTLFIVAMYWENRAIINNWFASTFDMDKFKDWLLSTLEAADNYGTPGLIIYAFIFAWWEVLSLSTSIVETAAGMAFGIRRAFVASAIGKYCGKTNTHCFILLSVNIFLQPFF